MRLRGKSGPLNAGPLITLLNLIDGEPWTSQSACGNAPDPDAWFPWKPPGRGNSTSAIDKAAAVCRNECPVRLQCAEEALDRDEKWGVWAGEYFDPTDSQQTKDARDGLRALLGRTA